MPILHSQNKNTKLTATKKSNKEVALAFCFTRLIYFLACLLVQQYFTEQKINCSLIAYFFPFGEFFNLQKAQVWA